MKQPKHPHNINISDRHKPNSLASFLLKYLFPYHQITSNSIPPPLQLLPVLYEITTPSQWTELLFTTWSLCSLTIDLYLVTRLHSIFLPLQPPRRWKPQWVQERWNNFNTGYSLNTPPLPKFNEINIVHLHPVAHSYFTFTFLVLSLCGLSFLKHFIVLKVIVIKCFKHWQAAQRRNQESESETMRLNYTQVSFSFT
jgi:hypothetical protein